MLVLVRRVGQTIHVGDDVVITVSEITRGSVRVAIEAPKEIRILRGELVVAEAAKKGFDTIHTDAGRQPPKTEGE